MWTKENRGRYDRSRLRYPSDLTDEVRAPVHGDQGFRLKATTVSGG